MDSSARRSNPVQWLMSFVRRPTPTDLFLRSRNARLIVQDGQSFHVVRLTSRCDAVASGTPIRLRVKLLTDEMVRVSLEDRNLKTILVDVTVPVDPGADAMFLNIRDIHLRLEVDAEPPAEK